MLGLPKTTEFNKRIPKQKFYENLTVTPGLKRAFTEQVKIIWWRNKIAAATVNLAPGEAVTEIEVLELRLNQPSLDESVLFQIDREIPYHILFLLEYEGKYQAWIGYKEPPPAVPPSKSANTITPTGQKQTNSPSTWRAILWTLCTRILCGKSPGKALRLPERRACMNPWSGTSGGNSSRNRSQRWRTKSEKKSSSTGRWS